MDEADDEEFWQNIFDLCSVWMPLLFSDDDKVLLVVLGSVVLGSVVLASSSSQSSSDVTEI